MMASPVACHQASARRPAVSMVTAGSGRAIRGEPAPLLGRLAPNSHVLNCRRQSTGTGLLSRAISSRKAAMAVDTSLAGSLKEELEDLLLDKERGIFGLQADDKQRIDQLVEQLEALNPTAAPMRDPSCVAGEWRVLYSTIKITGSKRTKLGLRGFVKIEDMLQIIDTEACTAANEVHFKVSGLGTFGGALTIATSFAAASDSRVEIKFDSSTLEPAALQKIFEKNYDMLLGIFNPEGWLDITYVDGTHRIGRDDKGNIFVLRRC